MPAMLRVMDRLEAHANWWPRADRSLVERIYDFAGGMMGLKEYEYLGECRSGPLPGRIADLARSILDRIEDHRAGKRRDDTVPIRVKELRRACLDALADPATTPEQAHALRHDLHDLFVAIQCFSYPGDYVRRAPTLERVSETLMKFEQDFLGAGEVAPHGPRRAILRVGEPIDVRARLAASGRAAPGGLGADERTGGADARSARHHRAGPTPGNPEGGGFHHGDGREEFHHRDHREHGEEEERGRINHNLN